MKQIKETASQLLKEFKGDNYIFGLGVLDQLGSQASLLGKNVIVVADGISKTRAVDLLQNIKDSLLSSDITLTGEFVIGAVPNAPYEDVFRIVKEIEAQQPDVIIAAGGGSTIDATKAAIAYSVLGSKYPNLDAYFGMGKVSEMLAAEGEKMIPMLAVETVAGSAAHLTKYSNVTNVSAGQKLLIVDAAVVPEKALFDYSVTASQPHSLTVDGALDGISHSLEVFMGTPEEQLSKVQSICLTGIELIVSNLKQVVADPTNMDAREAIGLGTDLGGYAIMVGGTNGAHLNSFSMTDILSHGRACALMNPYYVVFFAPAIENRLRLVGKIFVQYGYISENLDLLSGRDLGLAISKGMMALSKEIGFPTTLNEVSGFSDKHIERCLSAAKNPQLESKLKNMPVSLVANQIDEYMGSVLLAAKSGNMKLIKNL